MRFSVIIPVYKVEQFLHQCVDCVLAQTFTDYEVILIDDGSPDGSPVICDEYAITDNHIRVVHKKNGGLSSARNAGLDIAKGEYVLFLDSDDWWDDKEALWKIDTQLKRTKADVLVFGMKKYFMLKQEFGDIRTPLCDIEDNVTNEQKYRKFMEHNIFVACAWDKAVRRSLIETHQFRFVIGQLSEDIEWCAKLLLCEPNMAILKETFYVYRQQISGSITSNITRTNVLHVHDTIAKYAKENTPIPLKHYLANQLILLMSFSRKVDLLEISDLVSDAKKYWWLTKYNWYPYVRLVSKVRFLGFDITRFFLSCYHKYKRG